MNYKTAVSRIPGRLRYQSKIVNSRSKLAKLISKPFPLSIRCSTLLYKSKPQQTSQDEPGRFVRKVSADGYTLWGVE
jgi:hypothetical protein